ncbi:hypothetical protein [uncultured Dokdonia sp.]|uniref:hypothetical protein n=1 Tax=uncultured Dokdonia sp. TaxID=575653 RepID=UPI0026341B06|nr:hypothetical protein [uncultured Dokdonia sp.]
MIPSNNYIEFKRKREMGDIIADTFKFLRRNSKAVFTILAKTAGIPFVIFVIAQGYYTYISFSSLYIVTDGSFGQFESITMIISVIFIFASLLFYYSLLFTGISCTIKSYIDNKGVINETEVIHAIRSKIGGSLLAGIAKTFILGLATMVCFLPVIYFAVPLYIFFAVYIFENRKVSDALGKSFDIIKEEYWMTLFTMIVIGIIYCIATLVFSVPSMIYVWIQTFTSLQEISYTDTEGSVDMVTVILTTVASAARHLLYVIIPIGASFVYYNINERKHQTGTLERINSIGISDEDRNELNTNSNFNRL